MNTERKQTGEITLSSCRTCGTVWSTPDTKAKPRMTCFWCGSENVVIDDTRAEVLDS